MASGRDGAPRLPRSDELSREAAPLLAAVHGLRSGWMRRLLATAAGTKKRRMLAADSTVELPPFFSIVDIAAVEEKELKESNVALAQHDDLHGAHVGGGLFLGVCVLVQ